MNIHHVEQVGHDADRLREAADAFRHASTCRTGCTGLVPVAFPESPFSDFWLPCECPCHEDGFYG